MKREVPRGYKSFTDVLEVNAETISIAVEKGIDKIAIYEKDMVFGKEYTISIQELKALAYDERVEDQETNFTYDEIRLLLDVFSTSRVNPMQHLGKSIYDKLNKLRINAADERYNTGPGSNRRRK